MLSWRTPNPNDVQTPKSVHVIASTSTTSPRQPSMPLPQSGKKHERIVMGKPRR